MTNDEIMEKAKEFASEDVGRMYAAVAMVNEWQKETGGTLDEYLEYIETHCVKKKAVELKQKDVADGNERVN